YRRLANRSTVQPSDFMFAALAEYRLSNAERAIELFESGLERFPDHASLLLNFGRMAAESGQAARLAAFVGVEAGSPTSTWEDVFEKFPDPSTQVNLIAHLLGTENRQLAMDRIRAARTGFTSTATLWELADVMLQSQLKLEAQAIYLDLGARNAESLDDFFYSGLAHERLGHSQEAVTYLEQGLEKYPQSDRLLEQFARLCAGTGQIERAGRFLGVDAADREQICNLLLERFKDSAIQVPLIDYCLQHELLALADRRLEYVKTNSSDANTLWGIAELYSRLARRKDAVEIYQRLSQLSLRTVNDYYYAALGLLRLEKPLECLGLLEAGQSRLGFVKDLLTLYLQVCARNLNYQRYADFLTQAHAETTPAVSTELEFYKAASRMAPVDLLVNLKDLRFMLDANQFGELRRELVSHLRESPPPVEVAKVLVLFSRFLDTDPEIDEEIYSALVAPAASFDEAQRHGLELLHRLALPLIPHVSFEPEAVVRAFIDAANDLQARPQALRDPISDMTANWAPWQLIFCHAAPRLYCEAMGAFEKVALATWPRLDRVAPHVATLTPMPTSQGMPRKLRIGFNVHDSMPMMSGLLPQLDPQRFETFFLRPGEKGQSAASRGWCERAGTVVEYSDIDAYAAIDTLSALHLDIIVSGPAMASTFFPMMARLAPLQMVLLEPNWTDGLKNADYYISWGLAEPGKPSDFYATSVAYLKHPPYWIEKPSAQQLLPILHEERADVRNRLLRCGPAARVYLCANTPPKIHPEMDSIFLDLLQRDPAAVVVFLRAEYGRNLRIRLREKLGAYFERVVFLPVLPKEDAHQLLRAVDCCLDSYPLCGMSSSFDGAMLGVPIVTLPSGIPFGEWTAAIYKYIGVEGLTATNKEDYVDIAIRLAADAEGRQRVGAEIKEKSQRFVENADAAAEFQEFLLRAWERKLSGAACANWIDGRWQ
ncbi:MAG: tetratricopeptide repeat protein, partial [Hyphomicrobiales bacterium]